MDSSNHHAPDQAAASRRTLIASALLIFLVAFGVRLLSWHDTRLEVGKVQTAVTADYKRVAQLLRQGGVAAFLSRTSPLSDANNLGHPPGYPILMTAIPSRFGESETAIQFVQITCDAIAAAVIFLIAGELFSLSAALVAGILAGFSPQFAWNSVLLLPDSLAVLPLLLAVYCLARALKNPRLLYFIMAGALVGISCWLRANALLLTFFLGAATWMLFARQRPGRNALAVIAGTVLIVAPLTIRNAIVFHRFIPLSLGAGQTLLEGIADYDPQAKFGIPNTDTGIMKLEAEEARRPDYDQALFNPDGIERERRRLSRGLAVIRAHPFWFAGVMTRRAASMLRLERARLVSTEPTISHSWSANLQPVSVVSPVELLSEIRSSPEAKTYLEQFGSQDFAIVGDLSKYGNQGAWSISSIPNMDYILMVPIKIEQGRMRVSIVGERGEVYSTAVIEALADKTIADQPVNTVYLPFVPRNKVECVVSNETSGQRPVAKIGALQLLELGPARFLWTRYPRFLVHGFQKIFLTAVMLPPALIGLVLLTARRRWQALAILMAVPIYFFCVQSIVHTEYRYVLAVDYFLFALVGVAIAWLGSLAAESLRRVLRR